MAAKIAIAGFLAGLILLLTGFIPAAAGEQQITREQTLVLARVSRNPRKYYGYLKPMVEYAVSKMADLGIRQGKVLLARDNRQMITYLRHGRVDWVSETPFSATLFAREGGARFLVRRWKKGVPAYRTVFFTRLESDIRSPADLVGRVLAFEDQGSSSAFFAPAAILLRQGFRLTPLATPRQRPPAGAIGYVFAGQEINISTWVYKGLAAAGAYSNLDWDKEEHTPARFRRELRIFAQSRQFPRAVELVRGDLPAAIRERLRQILLAAHHDPAGVRAMAAYNRTSRFDPIGPETREALAEAAQLAECVSRRLR